MRSQRENWQCGVNYGYLQIRAEDVSKCRGGSKGNELEVMGFKIEFNL